MKSFKLKMGKSYGEIPDEGLRMWRNWAHELFDQLWNGPEAPMTRNGAYRWMARTMEKTQEEAHIGKFTDIECARLMDRTKAKLEEIKRQRNVH